MAINKAHARISSKALDAILRGTYRSNKGELMDGGGLRLRLNPTAPGGFWFYRYMRKGVSKKIGLGSLAHLSAAEARTQASELRARVRNGGDPQPERRIERAEQHVELLAKAEVATHTFDDAATAWVATKSGSKDTIENYQRWARQALPFFGRLPVNQVKPTHVAALLATMTHSNANRSLPVFANIASHAIARGWATVNPVDIAAVRSLLGNAVDKPAHEGEATDAESMPWQQVPEVVAKLIALRDRFSAQAVLMTILSGLRAQEVRGARWSEFDEAARKWTVPASRMKMKRQHIVPISDAMLGVLDRMRPLRTDSDYVFPGKAGQSISGSAMRKVLQKDLGYAGRTIRGFRRSLRNWGGELVNGRSRFASDAMECALAHRVAGGVRGHYYTLTHYAERVKIHAAWGAYCLGAARSRRHLKLAA